jgi:cytochrome P450
MSVDESPAEVPTPGALYGTDNPFGEGVELSEGTEAEVVDRPVSDWATDWSHTDPVWAADPFPIWDELRETCPVAHTDRFGGGWFPTRHDDVAAIAYDTEHFSSRSVVLGNHRPPPEIAPQGISPPISSDPPFHHEARRLLLPAFAPKAIAAIEPTARQYCEDLLDALEGKDLVDAATDYAQHIPVRVIAEMLGFPQEDADKFRQFINTVLEGIDLPLEDRFEGLTQLFEYIRVQIEEHIKNPRDDLTSFLLTAKMDGEPLNVAHVVGSIGLLLIAGIDTTWSAIGASIWHLAKTPADRQRLVDEPDLLPIAMEELLRAYSPVTMARLVKDDMEFAGCPMKKDDWILLSFPSANRDPEFVDDPDQVILDRKVNRHSAFGLGIHRCIGSHLARMEVRVALEAWLARYPQFSLADPDAVTWSTGQVRGPRTLPITIG